MIANAIALSILTLIGFLIVFSKLPQWVRDFMVKHTLLTDGVAMTVTYLALGGSVTGMMSAALVGIMVSCVLKIAEGWDDSEEIEKEILNKEEKYKHKKGGKQEWLRPKKHR